jgi:hypothetical protein
MASQRHYGILRLTMSFVGQAKGEKAFTDVTIPQEIKDVWNVEVITLISV